jgi:hypothetical protein
MAKLNEEHMAVLKRGPLFHGTAATCHWAVRGMTRRRAYMALLRLNEEGLVEAHGHYNGEKRRWWRLTDAGRAAISTEAG